MGTPGRAVGKDRRKGFGRSPGNERTISYTKWRIAMPEKKIRKERVRLVAEMDKELRHEFNLECMKRKIRMKDQVILMVKNFLGKE